MLTAEQKKYRDRANRARRGLLKEKEKFGMISDGSGKRYQAAVYFVLSGAVDKAIDFIEWFESEFPDDVGEPAFFLYATIAYYRAGNIEKAREYLLKTMLSNIYLLPYLFSKPLPKQDFWHSSNRVQPDYLWEIEEFLDEPKDEEIDWFREQFEGEDLTKIRKKYVDTFHALQHVSEIEKRGQILDEWYEYESSIHLGKV
ncbi:hypothetical protein QQM79_20540 [Marinobacteraceae bacterium S3BR75-40.1]